MPKKHDRNFDISSPIETTKGWDFRGYLSSSIQPSSNATNVGDPIYCKHKFRRDQALQELTTKWAADMPKNAKLSKRYKAGELERDREIKQHTHTRLHQTPANSANKFHWFCKTARTLSFDSVAHGNNKNSWDARPPGSHGIYLDPRALLTLWNLWISRRHPSSSKESVDSIESREPNRKISEDESLRRDHTQTFHIIISDN